MVIEELSEAEERVVARGTFRCPYEKRDAQYVVTQVVRRDDVLGEFVACRSCGIEFPPDVLGSEPPTGEPSLHRAFSLLFSAMIIADGQVKARELEVAKRLLAEFNLDYNDDVLDDDAKQVRGDLAEVLHDASQHLSLAQRRMLLEGAARIAAADGELRGEEHELITNAGRHMGFTRQGVQGFLDEAALRAGEG